MILLLPLIALSLVACSIVSPKNTSKDFDYLKWYWHKQKLSNLRQFKIHSLLIYSCNKSIVCARLYWKKVDKNYYLILTNLLGSTILKLSVKPNFVQLINNKNQIFTSTDVEMMINDLTGISIPFNNLCQWILGLPGSGTEYKFNNQYLLSEISYTQNCRTWKITYNSYNDKTLKIALPMSINVSEGNHSLILKIDRWVFK